MGQLIEARDGRLWCLICKTWWKECPCPGDVSAKIVIDKEVIEATTPKSGAYLEFIHSLEDQIGNAGK